MTEPTHIHIYQIKYDQTKCVISFCPNCECRRKMLAQFAEWHGWTVTCAHCGDRWEDGELVERPFERGWRKKSADRAKAILKEYYHERAVNNNAPRPSGGA